MPSGIVVDPETDRYFQPQERWNNCAEQTPLS
jgi:hypothetical protein